MPLLADGWTVAAEAPTLAELRRRRDEVVEVAASFGASNIRVFGSVVEGSSDENSDLDLLVDLAPGNRPVPVG